MICARRCAGKRSIGLPRIEMRGLVSLVQRLRIAGDPIAGDDALEAQWSRLDELDDARLALGRDVARVARLAADIAKQKDGQS